MIYCKGRPPKPIPNEERSLPKPKKPVTVPSVLPPKPPPRPKPSDGALRRGLTIHLKRATRAAA
jgi:hypothetical protein